MFSKAIVRAPADTLARGLTQAGLGKPDLNLALEQHGRYCLALEACGLSLQRLPANPRFPDSTFVEDTAVLTPRCAVITRPGAASRRGETAGLEQVLDPFFTTLYEIAAPGTLDGGDVCVAGDHLFIGLSERTNEEGARQLERLLGREGYSAVFVELPGNGGLLHLKSGLAWLGGRTLLAVDALAEHEALRDYEVLRAAPGEEYAANCVRINEKLLFAEGFPKTASVLRDRGYDLVLQDMSEFRKMDGGLSCLSLRF
jgi:dimethylargininase